MGTKIVTPYFSMVLGKSSLEHISPCIKRNLCLVAHWKKTCHEWDEQSCPDVDDDWPGQALIAWEDILLSGIEKDVSDDVYGALFAVYLAFGIIGYDLFSEYVH